METIGNKESNQNGKNCKLLIENVQSTAWNCFFLERKK